MALSGRLEKYGILVLDTSVVDLAFSAEFSKAVEEKQIAEQRAQRAVYIAQEAEQEAEANITALRSGRGPTLDPRNLDPRAAAKAGDRSLGR
jgi:regulator of protease activity HflC (stomatin/prohibitin superfamily)